MINPVKLKNVEKTFTENQGRILHLVCAGFSNKQIADAVSVSEKCVKWHLTNIYKRARVQDRVQLKKKYGMKGE